MPPRREKAPKRDRSSRDQFEMAPPPVPQSVPTAPPPESQMPPGPLPLPGPVPIQSHPSSNQPVPTSSKDPGHGHDEDPPKVSRIRKCLKYLYNREKREFCERTCKSWFYITMYSIMYLIFLTTYMLIFLYASLSIMKATTDFKNVDKTQLFTYSEHGIGLTAIPTSESSSPLIWYRNGVKEDYGKYIKSIDKLMLSRKSRGAEDLGQCGRSPYGYGNAPCVIIRINKLLKWTGKALSQNSTLAADVPKEVKDWIRSGRRMLWLHCEGYHPYDREHIGSIKYYPNPPGFDPTLFPLDVRNDHPLVAVQFSSFTHGVSLAIKCKLWHEHGPSTMEFLIYVEPYKTHSNYSDISKLI